MILPTFFRFRKIDWGVGKIDSRVPLLFPSSEDHERTTGTRASGLLTREIKFVALTCILLLACTPLIARHASASSTTNLLADPGFEIPASNAWKVSQNLHNGTVTVRDTTKPHDGSFSSKLSAVNTSLTCPSECGDTVSAAVEQIIQPVLFLDELANANNSFSAWWYVAPSSNLPPYSLHIELQFSDNSVIDYWYGHSDLAIQRYNLGPIPTIGSWFQMSRNLTADIQGVVASPSATWVTTVWFGAFGGSFMDCPICVSSAHGETAWVDDAALDFNVASSAPVASFAVNPTSGSAPLTVEFNASQSYEQGGLGTIAEYHWNFGDGSPSENLTQKVASHTFSNPGSYTVTLTVLDSNGAGSSPSSTTVKVNGADYNGSTLVAAGALAGLLAAWLVFRVRRRRSRRAKLKHSTG